MFVDVVPNRKSRPAVLLRESKREGRRVKKRTIANITSWPWEKVEALRRVLKNEATVSATESFEITRTRPHGHVAAVLGTLHRLGLPRILNREAHQQRQLALAMIVARILDPGSKLATARGLADESADSTLAEELGVECADEDDLYAAMDWLLAQQGRIETALARRHLSEGTLVLYDVSSSYLEGRNCPLARFGHSRDKRRDRLQIVYGLLCDPEGRPIAVEVFEGNAGDPGTLRSQIEKIRERFGIRSVAIVGDRGLITQARIREDLQPAGLKWITSLRSPAIQKLCREEAIQMSLFDERDLAEILHPDYPGERLMVCYNPALADERRRKRGELLAATERRLEKIAAATLRARNPLFGRNQISLRVGEVFGRSKVKKHFSVEISDTSLRYERRQGGIDRESAVDGLYVIRTSVAAGQLDSEATVRAYKSLSRVERAFRALKGIDLKVRPIFHRLADRVRAHVFLCMLAYYVEWHMRQALAPVLFQEEDPEGAAARRKSIVAPAQRSERTERKVRAKRTRDDLPVHSFSGLLRNLANIARNRIEFQGSAFDKLTRPSALQQRAFDLLQVPLRS